jgi:uncharacterized membrane protein
MAKAQQSANGPATARPGGRPGRGQAGRGGRVPAGARPGPARAADRVRNGDTAPVPPGTPPAPRWLVVVTGVLALIGVALSVYLTITHLHPKALYCADSGIVNCAAVTSSTQSKVFGIFPVAELGLAFYVFMAAICTPWAWRMRRTLRLGPVSIGARELRWIRLASIIAGMGFVLYLLFVEVIQLGQICLYCTGVHITTFLLFALLVFDSVFRQAPANSAAPVSAKRTKG